MTRRRRRRAGRATRACPVRSVREGRLTFLERHRSDRGQVGGVEVLPFAVLVFAAGTLLLANAWAAVDAKSAVTSAAREAARTFVEADSEAAGLVEANAAAEAALIGHGQDPSRFQLTASGESFGRCTRAVFEANYEVPVVRVPFIGGYGPAFTVSSTHTELVDPWRSGLQGASCAQ